MFISSVIEESYMNHIELIRQGVPMEIVKSFYDYALQQITRPGCMCELYENEVDMTCVDQVFTEDHGYVSTKLLGVVSEDSQKPAAERLFPNLSPREEVPMMDELELKSTAECRDATHAELSGINEPFWNGSVFPPDELLRYDKDQERACHEYQGQPNDNGLWLSATALTAYVMGIVEQILLLPSDAEAVDSILKENIRFVYMGARCTRETGERLHVPAIFLESVVTRAHLTLKNCSTGPSSAFVAGFPNILSLPEIVRGSHEMFPEAVRQMSSLSSYGRSKFLSWNGTHVFLENLIDVMKANVTLQKYNRIFSDGTVTPKVSLSLACCAGYTKTARLKVVGRNTSKEQCCRHTCFRTYGSTVKRSIMNEMCCESCNEERCNVEELARVLQSQAFGFDRHRESAVTNVW